MAIAKRMVLGAVCALALAGCATVNPQVVERVPQGPRAQELFFYRSYLYNNREPSFDERRKWEDVLDDRVSKYLREHVHPAVEEGLRASGRTRRDFTYATAGFVIIGDTEDELARARRAVRQQIAFYASTRTYAAVLAAHGWESLTLALHRKSVEGDWKGMADLITDEMVAPYAVTGTYATIGQKLRERYAGLLDRTALYQPYQPGLGDPRLPRLVKEFNG